LAEKPVRVEQSLLDTLTTRYPELKGEAESAIIRIGFKKLLAEADNA
jgi:hypothetical protein